jgi:hypothetical protein
MLAVETSPDNLRSSSAAKTVAVSKRHMRKIKKDTRLKLIEGFLRRGEDLEIGPSEITRVEESVYIAEMSSPVPRSLLTQ